MARLHGRNGVLYAALTSGGSAEPITYISQWSLDFSTDTADVTAMGDTNKVKVGGLPNAQGSYNGWYDDATGQLYTAAVDGVGRSFYLYPDRGSATKYFYGTGIFDMSISAGVDSGVAISGDFEASGQWSRKP